MGLLDKLLNRSEEQTAVAAPAVETCPHVALLPRWDSVADMGREDRISSYRCDACNTDFTPEEGRMLRASEAARVNMITPQSPN